MSQTTPMQERFLTTEEAAEIVGMSTIALRSRRHRGTGPRHYNPGNTRTVRYQYADLVAWMNGTPTSGNEVTPL